MGEVGDRWSEEGWTDQWADPSWPNKGSERRMGKNDKYRNINTTLNTDNNQLPLKDRVEPMKNC
jgi:hypothetical protein